MYTFVNDENLKTTFAKFYETEKSTAALCHATTILLTTKKIEKSHPNKDKDEHGYIIYWGVAMTTKMHELLAKYAYELLDEKNQ